jgi:Gas vesicle synthesis protein GvpL/GvpF
MERACASSPTKTMRATAKEIAMTGSNRVAVLNGPAKEQAVPVARGSHYLYAIVAEDQARSYPAVGIDGNDVYTITEGRLSAVVSGLARSKIRPQRTNLAAHQATLKCVMADTTPLPMVFGTIAASPEAIRRILVRNRHALQKQLQRVEGKVEMGLRVAWDVPNIFEYFVNTHPELRLARDRLVGSRHQFTQDEKIELGRMFDRLLNADREDHTGKVQDVLGPVCVEFKRNQCRVEQEVMNLACLVRREVREEFSAGVFAAATLFDQNFSFDYSGPWAPHNFVELDLDLEP